MKRTPVWTALVWAVLWSTAGQSATQAQIDQAWNKGVAWLLLNQRGDGGWSSSLWEGGVARPGLSMQATAATVESLSAMGIKTGYAYLGGVAWLENAEPISVDSLARQVIALKPTGKDLTPMSTRLLAWRNRANGWGAYEKHANGVVDTALGLRAMLDISSGYSAANTAACTLLTAQHTAAPDLGWPLIPAATNIPSSQTTSTIAATANAVLALHRWRGVEGEATCGGTTYSFATAFDNAVTWLLTKRNADNGFGDTGTSAVLESALALRLLKAVAPSHAALQSTLDYIIAQQNVDGSWSGGDSLHTAEVLVALTSTSTVEGQRPSAAVITDTDQDGVPDGVEDVMGTNPFVADSRFLAKGSGHAISEPARMFAVQSVENAPVAAAATTVDGISGISQAWNEPVDLELFIAGTSAQLPVLAQAAEKFFRAGSLHVLMDDGGLRGELSGSMYRAIYGTVEPDGKRVLIYFSANGGSEAGAVAVARALPVQRLTVNQDCVRSSMDEPWSCPLENVTRQVPDAGLSEVQPDWYGGAGSSVGTALTADELATLDAMPINAMAFGVGASRALRNRLDDLTHADLRRLLSGQVQTDWSDINPTLPAQPIVVCRLAKGAQPAAEALILGTGCVESARSAAASSTNAASQLAAPGYLIADNASTDAVIACLERADAGGIMRVNGADVAVSPGSFAVGVLGAERVPQGTEQWGYLKLDGFAPERAALLQGDYVHYAEAWMQWRNAPVNGIPAAAGEHLTVLQSLRAGLSDSLAFGDARATAGLGTAPGGMATTRDGNVCNTPVPAPSD